jgi:hypothetical protein
MYYIMKLGYGALHRIPFEYDEAHSDSKSPQQSVQQQSIARYCLLIDI